MTLYNIYIYIALIISTKTRCISENFMSFIIFYLNIIIFLLNDFIYHIK